MKNVIVDRRVKVPNNRATATTIGFIGKAIRDGSSYLPLRNYAAALASKAPRKDYAQQLSNVWNDFLKRWRYVRDPHRTETVTTDPRALFNLVIGHNGGAGAGRGVGDCDDATAAFGALASSIGFPVRIATVAPPGTPGVLFTHVFPQIYIPDKGWTSADPVLYPQGNLGATPPHSRIAYWDLYGRLLGAAGVDQKTLQRALGMAPRRSTEHVQRI